MVLMVSPLVAFPCKGHELLVAAAMGILRGLGGRAEARMS